jgi:hypothetical protein
MLLDKMAPLNKASLAFLVFAKMLGMLGVGFGFLGKDFFKAGTFLLSAAFFSIAMSITLVLLQSSNEKNKFEKEDDDLKKIRTFNRMKDELEKEILALQEQKNSLQNFVIRKGNIS